MMALSTLLIVSKRLRPAMISRKEMTSTILCKLIRSTNTYRMRCVTFLGSKKACCIRLIAFNRFYVDT
jgi:hypothetical protein